MARIQGKSPLKLELEIGPAGHGKVILGGKDISGYVTRVEFTAGVKQLTSVTLTLIDVEAVAKIDADEMLIQSKEPA